MCLFGNSMPSLPQIGQQPSPDNSQARLRAAQQRAANQASQGRAATILTSPLGDPGYGQSVNRTVLTGLNPTS